MYPINTRFDRGLILLAANSLSESTYLTHIKIKNRFSPRLGPYAMVDTSISKESPLWIQRVLKKSLNHKAVQLFNLLDIETRKKYNKKEIFKEA